jgi:5-deoxy-5-amino-3-dehydroquinate synthase
LMDDAETRSILEHEAAALIERRVDVLRRVITAAARVKAAYVAADELERSGVRAALNYGHTLAHAIETAGDHLLAHGEAVAVGLVFAGALEAALERVTPGRAAESRELVERLGLPVAVPPGLRRAELEALMRRDKKAAGGLTFVLRGPNGLEGVDDPHPHALAAAFAAVGAGE